MKRFKCFLTIIGIIVGLFFFVSCDKSTSDVNPDNNNIPGENQTPSNDGDGKTDPKDDSGSSNEGNNNDTKQLMAAFNYQENDKGYIIQSIKDKTTTEIVVPDCVYQIEKGAFNGCYNLLSIEIPLKVFEVNATNESYYLPFGYIFGDIIYLNSQKIRQYIYIGEKYNTSDEYNDIWYVPCTLNKIMISEGSVIRSNLFHNLSQIQQIDFSANIEKIENGAFVGCSSLKDVTLPSSLKEIEAYAFNECKSLTTLNVPDAVVKINENTFSGCTALKDIVLPNTLNEIGVRAFNECESLVNVNIPNNIKLISDSAFLIS